jgi:23S rRNA (cytosine1962-C5)-methyltransferase
MKTVILRGGPPVHPYVYSKRLHHVPPGVRDGDVVALATREGRPCGFGFAHRRSLIAVRVLSYDPDVFPDENWLRDRVRTAHRLRTEVLRLPEVTNAWRALHAEGDGLSGLVLDRYGTVGVVSLFSLGWHRRWSEVERVLCEETGLERVVARVDGRTSVQEGFEVPVARGVDPVEVHEHGVRFLVDPTGGHKTGFFLDQRDNRQFLATLSRGQSVFDGMTYTGGFALAAAAGGAAAVRAVDLDERALAQGEANAALNELSVTFDHGDVFDALRGLAAADEAQRPGVLIVDPAKWAKDRAGLGAALHRYGDLNRLALEAVRPGGIVVTNSCSGLVSEEQFLALIRGAAMDTRRDIRLLRVAGAGADHPVAGTFPEGRYLKSVFLAVGPRGSGPGSERARAGAEAGSARGGRRRRS